jgi:predicted RNA-binding Zn-ribbon protein involved in translation (DUF1610 family)
MSKIIIGYCRGGFKTPESEALKNDLVKQGRMEEAKAIDNAMRVTCGFAIEKPDDTELHVYPCPQCGAEIRIQVT